VPSATWQWGSDDALLPTHCAEQWEEELQKRRERSAGGKDVKETEDKPASDKEKPEDGKESKEGMFEGLKRTLLRNLHVEIRYDLATHQLPQTHAYL
jgi:hypothetical protein